MVVASAYPRGVVRRRPSSPDLSVREVVREEAGAVKKVQLVECNTMRTKDRLLRRDEEISALKELVRKKFDYLWSSTDSHAGANPSGTTCGSA